MSADAVITVNQVGKRYHVYENQRSRLLHALQPSRRAGVHEVWALRDISFQVRRGESFAVIGRNGSGKSTLLEIITQTLTPTTGSVQVQGRLAALLELGSGFNPEYTGRENVFLNGLLLGLTRAEVENRFDDIAAFADIGDVLDRPVKTYSSGMLVRLAFAVQVALDPDILIVDEALSVGDYFFQQKCFGRLRKMREDGLTLLFVSHDMGTVRDLCKRAIYLQKGASLFVGEAGDAIRQYFNEGLTVSLDVDVGASRSEEGQDSTPIELDPMLAREHAIWQRPPTDATRLLSIHISNQQEKDIDHARMGASICVKACYRTLKRDVGVTISLAIKNRYDQIVFVTNGRRLGVVDCSTAEEHYATFLFDIELALEAGLYSFKISIVQPIAHNKGAELDSTGWFGPFRIDWDYDTDDAPFLGMFGLSARGRLVLL